MITNDDKAQNNGTASMNELINEYEETELKCEINTHRR